VANPRTFKSRFELENERVERQQAAERQRLAEMEDQDRRFAQTLLDDEERAAAQARAEVERQAREVGEMQARERKAEQRRAAEATRTKMLEERARRELEERANEQCVRRTTKKCPKCRAPIEKNGGCAHMKCESDFLLIFAGSQCSLSSACIQFVLFDRSEA
jgi:hypothetical protein